MPKPAKRAASSGSLRDLGNGAWLMRVSAGKDPFTGKYRQISRTFHGGKRDAQHALNEFANEVRKAKPTGTREPFSKAIDEWLKERDLEGCEYRTMQSYKQLSDVVREHLGEVPMRLLTRDHLKDFYAMLKKRGLSPATIQRYHVVVNGASELAVSEQWVPANLARGVKRPRRHKPKLNVPTTEQVHALIAAADAMYPEFAAFMRLAVSSWARRGELCALQWSAVNFDDLTIRIEASAISKGRGQVELKDTKSHGRRVLDMDVATMDYLADYRQWLEDRAKRNRNQVDPEGFVFSNRADLSKPWHPDTATQAFQTARDNAGVRRVRLHDLRHYGPTQAITAKMPINLVSHRLGHANITTTLNIYVDYIPTEGYQLAEFMGGLLAPPLPPPEALPAGTP